MSVENAVELAEYCALPAIVFRTMGCDGQLETMNAKWRRGCVFVEGGSVTWRGYDGRATL